MAKWGDVDLSEFNKFTKNLEKASNRDLMGRFISDFLIEMAMRADRKIKKRTPVGKTGQLRRNWKVGSIQKSGNAYVVEISNETHYASFVEYGHRTRDLKGWVEGRFMATIPMKEIERELPKYLEKRFTKFLEGLMGR
ncbi:HK97 gp10 family phage protein [Paenibacillus larvae]|uniref:Phage protein n=1 Tax=Paenibacillus larvae subsp. larvae TaxID=147375 RepID=A0A6C0QPM2_9BACL|nr:HK97 gp10 family phage protein [Paenibacillus larvae]QHZ50705.1 phage protein [Paenibacillus larvae subsp. larvae]